LLVLAPAANAEEIASETLPLRVHFEPDDDPAFADAVLAAAEDAWRFQVDEQGFRAPPPDGGANGSDDFDLSVGSTPWIAVTGAGAPAPGRPFGVTSSILVDRGIPVGTLPLVVAHELTHAIHLGTCAWGNGVQEAAAVYVSGLEHDGDGWRLGYYLGFDDFQSHPDRSVDWLGALGDFYPYGAALWLVWAGEASGRPDVTLVRELWSALEDAGCPDVLAGFDELLDVDARFVEFERARYFVGPLDDGRHWRDLARWEGPASDAKLASVALAADVAASDLPIETAFDPGPMPYGASYVRVSLADLAEGETISVVFEGADGVRWRIGTIETRSDAPADEGEIEVDSTGTASFEVGDLEHDSLVLVAVNLGDGTYEGLPEERVGAEATIRLERTFPEVPVDLPAPPETHERRRAGGCSAVPSTPTASPAMLGFALAFVLLRRVRRLAFVLFAGCLATDPAERAIDAGADVSDGAIPDASADLDASPPWMPPEWCPRPEAGLQDVTGTPASPYYVHQPDPGASDPSVVVFLPGGFGDAAVASLCFDLWLSEGDRLGDFRVVVPYSADGDFTDERDRVPDVLDEALLCFGPAPRVHLAGTSLGGLAAYALALEAPDRFATLLGAPGTWDPRDEDAIAVALAGKSVLHAVGELDDDLWQTEVQTNQAMLERLGIDSTVLVMEGEGHILSPGFDESVFFDFWAAHD